VFYGDNKHLGPYKKPEAEQHKRDLPDAQIFQGADFSEASASYRKAMLDKARQQ
jgi:hypothetical protein